MVGLVLTLLAGCSAIRLAYGQADTLLFHAIDRYLDLDRSRAEGWRAATSRWVAWHRRVQLPEVVRGLDAMARDWAAPKLPPERACQHLQAVQGWADEAMQAALPDLARLVPRLGPDQLAQLAEHQADDRQRWERERLAPTADERRRLALERLLGRYERLVGDLNPAQRADLAALVERTDDPERAVAEQRRRQAVVRTVVQDLVAASAASAVRDTHPQDAQSRLAAAWQAWRQGPPDSQAWQQAQMTAHCQFLSRLHATADADQRNHAVRELTGWRDDLRALVQAGAGPDPISAPAR